MIPQVLPVRFVLNPRGQGNPTYGPDESGILSSRAHAAAYAEISSWEGYAPTPLRELRGLAGRLGIGTLWYKDEGSRFGLGSFKALGGTYGVLKVLQEVLREAGPEGLPSSALRSGEFRDRAQEITVTCASAGNHGRAVAMGARMFGCRAAVFLPRDTAAPRLEEIRALGAEVHLVDGSYDDAVAVVQMEAEDRGWHVVSDTAYPGYEDIPRHIMQGYTILAREALEQLPSPPTHCFLQGGVGGLAAAVTAYTWETAGPRGKPVIVVVEPAEADCLLESALNGRWTPSRGNLQTTLSCLACRSPSTLAWPILERGARAFLSIPDFAASEMTELLAHGVDGDPPVGTQPTGAAGLTGLVAALFEPALFEPLGLGTDSRVLIIGSEGPP